MAVEIIYVHISVTRLWIKTIWASTGHVNLGLSVGSAELRWHVYHLIYSLFHLADSRTPRALVVIYRGVLQHPTLSLKIHSIPWSNSQGFAQVTNFPPSCSWGKCVISILNHSTCFQTGMHSVSLFNCMLSDAYHPVICCHSWSFVGVLQAPKANIVDLTWKSH